MSVLLEQEAETDLTFTLAHLTEFTLSLPKKRAKWLKHMMAAMKIKDAHEESMKIKAAELHVYYREGYSLSIDRRDIEYYVTKDSEYVKLSNQFNSSNRTVKFIEKVLSALEKASFDVGNIVKYEIFKHGN